MALLPLNSLKKVDKAIDGTVQEKKNTFGVFAVSDLLGLQVQEYLPVFC